MFNQNQLAKNIEANNPHLKLITEGELLELIKKYSINLYSYALPANFDWKTILIKSGFRPEFKNIKFDELKVDSAKGDSKTVDMLSFANFNEITFKQCQFGSSEKCKFNNCIFKNNTFKSLAGVALQIEFNNCRLIKNHFINFKMEKCLYVKSVFLNCTFENSSLESCNINNGTFKFCFFEGCLLSSLLTFNCSFLHCHFLSKTILADIDGLDDDIDKFNFLDKDTTTSNTALDFIHFRKYYATIEKPVIVMLYAPSDGVANANLLLNILKRYKSGIEIILITPNMGSNHPIFSDSKSISGFILPGGPNVDDDNFIQRKTFETFIIETALQNKTPLLGICRGHQVIGKYFGGKIKSLNNHEADTILVKKKDSELYRFVEKKYNKSSSDTRYVNMQKPLIAKDDSANKIVYSYLSSCLHKQGVFFNNDKIKNGISVKVVAKAKDGVSEALEINGHIVTYQHHHEDYYDQHQNNPQGKLAKSLIKKFVNMTIDYYQPRDNFNRKIVL